MDKIKILAPCVFCGTFYELEVGKQDLEDWESGCQAIVCFPYLSAEKRELLTHRTCPTCKQKYYGKLY